MAFNGFSIAVDVKSSVKPRDDGKNVGFTAAYDPSHAFANRLFDGRNGDRSMTKSVNEAKNEGGLSVRGPARAFLGARPSLGSSHALLLLSSP